MTSQRVVQDLEIDDVPKSSTGPIEIDDIPKSSTRPIEIDDIPKSREPRD